MIIKNKKLRKVLSFIVLIVLFVSNNINFNAIANSIDVLPNNGGIHPMFPLRSNEEKLTLLDDNIEWNEIEKIIHDYNPEVRNLWNGYKTNQTNNDITENYMDMSERYDSLSGNATDEASEARYKAQSYAMQINADNNVSDSITTYYECLLAEAKIVLNCKNLFVNYYTSNLLYEISALTEKEAEREYLSAENKYSIGSATKVDALNAQVEFLTKQSETVTALSNLNQTKQNLLIILGRDYKSQTVVFGNIPTIDFDVVTMTNLEMDKITALDKNYQYKIYQRNLENSSTDAVKSKYTLLVSNAKDYINSDIETKYRTMKDSLNALLLANQKMLADKNDFEKIKKEYNLGSISKREYMTAEYKNQVVSKNAVMAYYDFYIVYNNYLAAVNGCANASAS